MNPLRERYEQAKKMAAQAVSGAVNFAMNPVGSVVQGIAKQQPVQQTASKAYNSPIATPVRQAVKQNFGTYQGSALESLMQNNLPQAGQRVAEQARLQFGTDQGRKVLLDRVAGGFGPHGKGPVFGAGVKFTQKGTQISQKPVAAKGQMPQISKVGVNVESMGQQPTSSLHQLPPGKARLRVRPTDTPNERVDILQEGYSEIGSLAQAPKKTLSQKFDEFYTNWVDRYNPIVRAAEKVEKLGKVKGFELRPEHNPKFTLKKFLGMGATAEHRYNKELKPVLKQLDDFKIPQQDIDVYLKARRDINLGGRGIKGSSADKGTQRAQLLEQKYGDSIKQIANQLYDYQSKGFQELASAGFFEPNVARNIQLVNADYVPFQRVMDQLDEYLGIPSKSAQQSVNPVKGIKGSDKQIYSPVESIVANTYKQRAAIEKNKVTRSVVDLGKVMPELGFVKTSKSGSDTVTVWEDGQKVHYQVGAEIATAVKGLSEENMNSFLQVLTIPAQLLRQGATGRNPEFMIPNMVRDQFDAATNSKYGYVPFLDWARGLAHLIKKDEIYEAWVNSGGAQTLSSMSGRDSIHKMLTEKTVKKKIIPKLFSWLGQGLDVMGSASEQPTRLGLFNKAYKKTGNAAIGAFESREGTLDFARMGAKMKVANSIIPFLNVGIQGFDKIVRTAKSNPVRFGVNMSLFGAMPSVATTLYNITYHPEEYAEVPQFVKDDNFIIVTGRNDNGNVDYIAIPKGNVIRYVANPTENFLSYMAQTYPQSLQEMATQFLSSGLPVVGDGQSLKEVALKTIGSNLPQAIKPVTENLVNKSFYKYNTDTEESKDIVPKYLNKLPAGEREYEFTPGAYKAIGRVLNVSPLQIQNLLEGYFAGYVKIPVNILENMQRASEGEELDKNKIPVLRRFIQETYPSKSSNGLNNEGKGSIVAFGKNDERAPILKSAAASEEQTSVSGLLNKVNQDGSISALEKEELSRVVRQINEEKEAIFNNKKLTEAEKNQKLEQLNEYRKQLLEVDNKKKVDYSGVPLTGNAEIDKLIISKQVGEIKTKINDVIQQFAEGKITTEELSTQINALKELEKAIKSKGGGKGKKVRVRMGSVPKVSVRKTKFKTKKLKLPKIKLNPPKKSKTEDRVELNYIPTI